MIESPLPDFIIVGPQKCASSWLYHCLYEHPEVLMPETDAVHYFDMNYHRDLSWYREFFSAHDGEPVVGEETPSYIREEDLPRRIDETLNDPKLIFLIRNPMDRAFSHWWHYYSHDDLSMSFEFEEVFELYDLWENWIVPGFYHRHISRYKEHFSDDKIKLCFFDDLVEDDLSFVQDVYSFLDIDDNYEPSVIGEKSNQGRYRALHTGSLLYSVATNFYKRVAPQFAVDAAQPVNSMIEELMTSDNKYEEGMDPEIRGELERIFANDIEKLSDHTGRDLNHWFEVIH